MDKQETDVGIPTSSVHAALVVHEVRQLRPWLLLWPDESNVSVHASLNSHCAAPVNVPFSTKESSRDVYSTQPGMADNC